ncbi:unnamed protein product [Blepharisma stoltei]|uniref:Uncharacterized protein n=1 Tax=Blepharisma stoltei TaxID=1481888 RepID=A0AAU9IM00_9CILI|nr:unnamed protein product [Blepharisma stoltei]
MVLIYSEIIIYIIYARFGYLSFKALKAAGEDLLHIRKKVLLEWVACTCLLYYKDLLDYFFESWIPWFYLWKSILISILLIEKSIAIKILFKFQNHIDRIETIIDKTQYALYSCLNFLFYPILISLLSSFKWIIQAATDDQKKEIDSIVDSYLLLIRRAKTKQLAMIDSSKKTKLRPPSPDPPSQSQRSKSPIKTAWKTKVQMQLKKGSNRFFAFNIWFDLKKKHIIWRAEGDDKTISDEIVSCKIKDYENLLLEVVLTNSTKLFKFYDIKSLNTWEGFLQRQCSI